MTFDKQSNGRRTRVESKLNRTCNHCLNVPPIKCHVMRRLQLRFDFDSTAVRCLSEIINGCININHMVRQHCFSFTDDSDRRFCVAQFLRELLLLGDRPSTDSSCNVLTRTELDVILLSEI